VICTSHETPIRVERRGGEALKKKKKTRNELEGGNLKEIYRAGRSMNFPTVGRHLGNWSGKNAVREKARPKEVAGKFERNSRFRARELLKEHGTSYALSGGDVSLHDK